MKDQNQYADLIAEFEARRGGDEGSPRATGP
jgi:hypothetical protein